MFPMRALELDIEKFSLKELQLLLKAEIKSISTTDIPFLDRTKNILVIIHNVVAARDLLLLFKSLRMGDAIFATSPRYLFNDPSTSYCKGFPMGLLSESESKLFLDRPTASFKHWQLLEIYIFKI